jgi:uncharacterized protein YaaR (DUF327 family)
MSDKLEQAMLDAEITEQRGVTPAKEFWEKNSKIAFEDADFDDIAEFAEAYASSRLAEVTAQLQDLQELVAKAGSRLSYIIHRADIRNWKSTEFGFTHEELRQFVGELEKAGKK